MEETIKIKVNFMISQTSKENIDNIRKLRKISNSSLLDTLLQFNEDSANLFNSLYEHQNNLKNKVLLNLSNNLSNQKVIPEDLIVNLNSLFMKAQGKEGTLSLVCDIENFIHEKRLSLNKITDDESLETIASQYNEGEHGKLNNLVKLETPLTLK